jgi:uncharacterized membrane protein
MSVQSILIVFGITIVIVSGAALAEYFKWRKEKRVEREREIEIKEQEARNTGHKLAEQNKRRGKKAANR